MITDGVFYDMPFPQRAIRGLEAYKAIRFAVGIAVHDIVNKKENRVQARQLNQFAGTPERYFDLDTEGWAVLSDVAFKVGAVFVCLLVLSVSLFIFAASFLRYTSLSRSVSSDLDTEECSDVAFQVSRICFCLWVLVKQTQIGVGSFRTKTSVIHSSVFALALLFCLNFPF
jgi:hypothetical protein